MNILVTCSYWYYADFSTSFIHGQAKAYAAAGQRVRVLIPLPLGSHRLPEGAVRLSPLVHRLEQNGVEIYYLTAPSLSNFGNRPFGSRCLNTQLAIAALWPQLSVLTRDFSPDVIHAHAFGYGSEMGAWLAKKLDCPLVLTTHGGDLNTPFLQGQTEHLQSWCRPAAKVIAVSRVLADKLIEIGVSTPVSCIYNGFAVERIQSAPKRAGQLIQAGSLVPSKHNDHTLQALSRLRAAHPELTLTIVGDGPQRPRLERLCHSLHLEAHVRFTGRLSNDDVFMEMSQAEFFVMPSHPEGFGIVYLEAMASGCITIGTEGEGIADVIRHGENGFLVPPNDPEAIAKIIDWCLMHREEAAAIAQRGREDALRLTWAHNANQYIQLFKELTT